MDLNLFYFKHRLSLMQAGATLSGRSRHFVRNSHQAAFGATRLEQASKSAARYSAVESEVHRLSLAPSGEHI